jgi:hypothetical protein
MLILPPDHVVASFSNLPTPSLADLKKTFKGGVSNIFGGRRWRRHAVVIMAGPPVPGEQIIWLADPPRELLGDDEEIIAWGSSQRTEIAPNGYRPIMGHNSELVDLHMAHPELCKQFWMAALGSSTLDVGGRRFVAVLGACGGEPCLLGFWFDSGWFAGYRFPFVRKVVV